MFLANAGDPGESFLHLRQTDSKSEYYIDSMETLYRNGAKGDVWGAVVHWKDYMGGMEYLKKKPGLEDINDFEVLNHLFPGVKFIYLYRLNKVKQAISWVKVKQSKRHEGYRYDELDIERTIVRMCQDDACWMNLFERYNITPHFLTYESLCENKVGTISNILDFLGIQFVSNTSLENHLNNIKLPVRQYDATNEEWYRKFLKEKYG